MYSEKPNKVRDVGVGEGRPITWTSILNNMCLSLQTKTNVFKDFENLEVGDTVYTVCETELLG